MDRISTTRKSAPASWRVIVLSAVPAAVAIVLVWLVGSEIATHFQVAILVAIQAAAATATIAGSALALARHREGGDKASLFLGAGLLGAGLFHICSVAFAASGTDASVSADVILDWTGLTSRLWLSLGVYAGWLATRHVDALGQFSSRHVKFAASGVMALVMIALLLIPLPRIDTPNLLVARPLEMVPAAFFALSLSGYVTKGQWKQDRFERLLSIGLVWACVGQFALIFVSRSPIDATFVLAQAIQLSVYGIFLAALIATAAGAYSEVQSRDAERHRDAIELANAREGLEAFMRSASHDLKAPLRHIFAFSKLIRDDAAERLTESEIEDLERVMGAASHMSNLLESLLRFTRLGVPLRENELISLNELVETVVAQLPREDQSRVVINAPLPDIRGDQALLTIVLQNLIENGLKYVDDSRAVVTVTSTSTPSETTVSVDDNGIGVARDNSRRIFDPGVRGVSDAEFEGTGFGLATCARIIHAHDGRIWLESKPEGGSVFRFTIPG